MQKKIIALAIAAAFAAPAVALADVTMYGTMDGGFRHQNNEATGITTNSMQMGQYNSARFGLKSVEDMGNGMKANVVLETSYAPAGIGSNPSMTSGAVGTNSPSANPFGLLFDRQATIGLSGSMGTVDMGWNYTTSFKVIKTYDPLDYKWLGQAGAKTADVKDRAGNLTYSNKFGDVTVLAEYDVTDESKTAAATQGSGTAVGALYNAGPINVGAAYSANEAAVGSVNKMTHVTVGAGFNFGDGKVSVGYAKKATKTALNDSTDTNMWAGVSYNVSSAIGVKAAYYSNATNAGTAGANDATKKTMIIGATYALSKKTELYASLDRATSVSATSVESIVSGSTVGLSTVF